MCSVLYVQYIRICEVRAFKLQSVEISEYLPLIGNVSKIESQGKN